jgi:hypothetical protein
VSNWHSLQKASWQGTQTPFSRVFPSGQEFKHIPLSNENSVLHLVQFFFDVQAKHFGSQALHLFLEPKKPFEHFETHFKFSKNPALHL